MSLVLFFVVNGYYVRSPYFYLDPFVQFANKGYITKFVVTSYTPAIPGSPGTPASATIVATINTILNSVPASTTVTINWIDTATPQSQNYTGTFIISTYTGTYNIYIYSVDPILPHIVNGSGFYIIQIIPQGTISNYIVSNYIPTNATITATGSSFVFEKPQQYSFSYGNNDDNNGGSNMSGRVSSLIARYHPNLLPVVKVV